MINTVINKSVALALCVCLLVVMGYVWVQPSAAQSSAISERQEIMKFIGKSMRDMSGMARGKTPYDSAAVVASLRKMEEGAFRFNYLFPADSQTGGDTKAKPEIWSDMKTFLSKSEDSLKAMDKARRAAPDGLAAFKPAFAELGGTCSSCHKLFRAK